VSGGILITILIIIILFQNSLINLFSQTPPIEPIPLPPKISQALQNILDTQAQSNVSTSLSNSNLPTRIKIPKIKVDAAVEYLGVTPTGAMDVPKGPDDVAWFDLGPRPGEIGSAVIAGHYGWKNNIPAVFDNLYKLKIGDKIYIDDDLGSTTTFTVREIGMYDQNGDASSIFDSSDGKAHLNLITCEGVWNVASKSRPNRLVIFTDKGE
jgi:LPXTG-site transpeptidase (sortase) family protein